MVTRPTTHTAPGGTPAAHTWSVHAAWWTRAIGRALRLVRTCATWHHASTAMDDVRRAPTAPRAGATLSDAASEEGARRRAFLSGLPAPVDDVLRGWERMEDPWWVASSALAAVRAAGTSWTASATRHVLTTAASRSSFFDAEIEAALEKGPDYLQSWLEEEERLPRLLLRRRLWLMRWLLSIPISHGEDARAPEDLAAWTTDAVAEHAHRLCIKGDAVGLRALLGTHASVARALFPYRFVLLSTLLTAGGVPASLLLELRLLPGTRLPVEDRESGAWVELAVATTSTAAAAWVEDPALVRLLAEKEYVCLPPRPPAPPAGLAEWYTEVLQELESVLGWVDRAGELARAGVRLGLVPLRTIAQELAFVALLQRRTGSETWRAADLPTTDAPTLLSLLLQTPQPPEDATKMLRDDVLPFLQHGTYAHASAFHAASGPTAGVLVALAILSFGDKVPRDRAFALALHIALSDWIAEEDRDRLLLATVLSCDASDKTMYATLYPLTRKVPPLPQERAPLSAVLAASPCSSAHDVYAMLDVVPPEACTAAWTETRACMALGHALQRHGLLYPPRTFLHIDEAQGKELALAMVRRVQGSAAALETLLDSIAPYVDVADSPAPLLPSAMPAWLFTQLLSQRQMELVPSFATYTTSHPRLSRCFPPEMPGELVLSAARAWMAQATSLDPLHSTMQRATECLHALPPTQALQDELDFVGVLAQLARYRLPSLADPAEPLTPDEVRAMPDRLVVLARLLALHPTAYRAPSIRGLARGLASVADVPQAVSDVRIDAMLADAAAASGDFVAARDLCERAARMAKPLPHDAQHEQAHDAAFRACFQLAKHPEWTDERARSVVFGQALAMAAPAQLPRVLEAWQGRGAHANVPAATARPPRSLSQLLGGKPRPPATPERPVSGVRQSRALFDHLGEASPGSAPSLLASTAALRDIVGRRMGWWMGEPAQGASP